MKKSYPAINDPIQAQLLERVNRFACTVELNGSFSPFSERDPALAQILQQAKDEGVNILALMFDAGTEMTYIGELDVILSPQPFNGLWPDQGY